METRIYTTIDRIGWPAGPWDNEPDKVQWPDPATGLPCLAVRNRYLGHWCGYVGVAPDHPLHGTDYSGIYDLDISAHGGLTYADACNDNGDECDSVCHVAGPGEPDHVWWFGFDCARLGDVSPGNEYSNSRDEYRTLAYVQGECVNLARQLAALKVQEVAA